MATNKEGMLPKPQKTGKKPLTTLPTFKPNTPTEVTVLANLMQPFLWLSGVLPVTCFMK